MIVACHTAKWNQLAASSGSSLERYELCPRCVHKPCTVPVRLNAPHMNQYEQNSLSIYCGNARVQVIQKLTVTQNVERGDMEWDRRTQIIRGRFLESFLAKARKGLDKRYPAHSAFCTRNRDRFFFKVEQGLKVSNLQDIDYTYINISILSVTTATVSADSRSCTEGQYCWVGGKYIVCLQPEKLSRSRLLSLLRYILLIFFVNLLDIAHFCLDCRPTMRLLHANLGYIWCQVML